MGTAEFAAGVAELEALAEDRSPAVLCAEAGWFRCHRRMLADYLVLVGGRSVEHLFHDGRVAPHVPTQGVRVEDGGLVYGPPALFEGSPGG